MVGVTRVYVINCREVGQDCDFEARGLDLDDVIEQCAEHGRQQHNMRGFGTDLYARMRRHLKVLEEEAPRSPLA